MELTRTADKKSLVDYAVLRRRVREAFAKGKARALDAVDREKR